MSTKTRKRGGLDDSDVKHVSEQNKKLKRKMASLLRENGRLKKEKDRWKEAHEGSDEPEEELPQEQPAPPAQVGVACPHCGSADVETFQLDVQGSKQSYFRCKNAQCKRRGRMR